MARDDQEVVDVLDGDLPALLRLARRIGREHRSRQDLMPGVDEPRWMILVEIFVITGEGHDVPFMSAAGAGGVSISTGQRYVHDLINAGLLVQGRSDADQRITHVSLSSAGAALVEEVLTQLATVRSKG